MNKSWYFVEKNKLFLIISSSLLAFIFSLIPWEKIRFAEYYDRDNYINYIDFYENKVHWFDFSGIISKLSNEWLWHYIIELFNANFGFNSSVILWFISFLFLLISFKYVAYESKLVYIFLLLNPVFIDFFYSQLRLTFAISFLYLSLFFFKKNKLLSFLFLIPGFFIHTSIILFSFIFYFSYLLLNININQKFKLIFSILVGFVVALLTGPYMSIILGTIEDRRAEYNDMSSPILYMSFWVLFFIYLVCKIFLDKYNLYNKLYYYVSISVLTMVFLNTFLSGYSSRFLAASMPFIILALINLKGRDATFSMLGYIMYLIMLWFFWIT